MRSCVSCIIEEVKRTLEVAEPRARFLYEPLSESKIKQQGLWGGSVSVPSVLVYFQCILDDLMPILRPFVKELDGGGITIAHRGFSLASFSIPEGQTEMTAKEKSPRALDLAIKMVLLETEGLNCCNKNIFRISWIVDSRAKMVKAYPPNKTGSKLHKTCEPLNSLLPHRSMASLEMEFCTLTRR